jgi:hypothetical protein
MLIEIQWHPTVKQLRVFGAGGLLASVAAALVLYFAWGLAALWAVVVFAIGAVLCLCSLVSPRLTRLLYIGLTLVAMPIGFVVSIVLLAVFFFVLLTPVAVILRLMGRDALCRSWRGRPTLVPRGEGILPSQRGRDARDTQGQDGLATSYWVPHKPSEDMERYFHQF